MGAVGCTTTTDPRSQRNRAGRRGGQLLTRARSSLSGTACPRFVLPVPRSPDGRTIREDQPILARRGGTKSIMPVTNPLERLNKEVKRRADVVGIFPNEASIVRLIGAVLLEANDEWQLQHRYMQTEAMSKLTQLLTDPVPDRLSTEAA